MNQAASSRRVWIKKPSGAPTTLIVGPDDLVDDLKTLVMEKYPTSLARELDPADLNIRIDISPLSSSSPLNGSLIAKKQPKLHPFSGTMHEAAQKQGAPISPIPVSSTKSPLLPSNANYQRPNSRNEDDQRKSQSPFSGYSAILRPDQNVWRVLDSYFPNGMTMNDALVIEAPQSTPTQLQHPQGERGSSSYSSVFNSYVSPAKDAHTAVGAKNPQQVQQATRLHHPHPQHPLAPSRSRSGHSMSISTDIIRQAPSRKSAVGHRRSMSNPQSPSATSTILMLPKDYNGNKDTKEKLVPATLEFPDNKPKSLDKITEVKQENAHAGLRVDTDSPVAQLPVASKKIKSTTEKVFPSINILIVEDNKINQKILQAFLRKRKINFQTAVNGEEAIDKWRQGSFHLVLMDIQLPVKSGIEAAIEIRRLEKLNGIGLFSNKSSTTVGKIGPQDELDISLFRSPVIIVALTASTSRADRQKALAAGCNDYLTKPVNLDWLQNKITEWGCMQALIDFDHWKN